MDALESQNKVTEIGEEVKKELEQSQTIIIDCEGNLLSKFTLFFKLFT